MFSVKRAAIVVAVPFLVAAGCQTLPPVYNVTDAPVSTSKASPSLDEVGKAIQRAGASLGFAMKSIKPGQILGTYNFKTHTAVVDIAYTTKSYSIQYKDSTDLKYDGTNIHSTYNRWVQNLDKRIRAELSLL